MTVEDLVDQFWDGKLDFDALAEQLADQKWATPPQFSPAEKLTRSSGVGDEYEPPDPDSFLHVKAAWNAGKLTDEQYAQLRQLVEGKPEDKPRTKTT